MGGHRVLIIVIAIAVVAAFCVGLIRRLYRGDRESDQRTDQGFQHRDEYRNRNGPG